MGGHRNMEYAFWANEQTFGSAILLLVGGLIGVLPYKGFNGEVKSFMYYWAGVYSLVVGLIVALLEYPRGKRNKGSIVERRFQRPLAVFVSLLGPLMRNYFSRFVIYFVLAFPCYFLVTTFLGGVGMAIGSLIYLVSAMKGEQWRSPTSSGSQASGRPGKYVAEAPNNPPPRRPDVAPGQANMQS